MPELDPQLVELGTSYAVKIVGALVLLALTFILGAWARSASMAAFRKAKLDATLAKFFANVVRYLILITAILACLSIFGIQTTSFAAILGAAGLAIGLSLQGSLANFASGIMLLAFRPFKVGDVVNTAGQIGKIDEIELFTTRMVTPDNRLLILPNAKIFGDTIENITFFSERRVDISVGTDYGADLDETRKVLEKAIASVEGVLAEPASQVFLAELGGSSIDWKLRAWAKTEDYWTVFEALTRATKIELDKAGIGIPYPQMDVHLDKVASIAAAALVGFGLLFSGGTAFAQAPEEVAPEALHDKVLAEPKEGEEPKKKPDGWKITTKLGVTFSLNDASNVVGVDDGTTLVLGGLLEADANLRSGQHMWENKLIFQHQQSKTPALVDFVKSLDNLELKSTYYYRFANPDWLGPFAKAKFQTSILDGAQISSEPMIIVDSVTGAPIPGSGTKNIKLTSAFEPFVIKESGGAFANPWDEDEFTAKIKLGAGGQHIIAQGGYVIQDDDATAGIIEARQLQSVNEAGGVLEFDLKGLIVKDTLSWTLDTDFFYAFASSNDQELDAITRFNVDLNGKLTLKMYGWLTFDYALLVRHIPAVSTKVQVQNSVVVGITYDVL